MADNVISKIKLPDNQEYILKDSNAARSNHTHDISLEKDTSGTNQLTLAAGTKYKLTAGGESYIFTTPADANNKVTIAADTTTNANYPLVFGSTNTSTTTAKTEGLQKSTTKFYVNPSTGNIQATTFNGITLAAAAAKSITDNSSNADVTSSDTNLITGRTLYYQLAKKGYTTNTGTVTNVATGAGLTGGPIAITGTISIATSGVTNDMLAGSIANSKLANSSISIAGTSVSLGSTLAAETLRTKLGLSTAMHFRGIATVAYSDNTFPAISGYSTKEAGDVVIDKDSKYEYIWTGSAWELLGGDESYKTIQSAVSDPSANGNAISFIDTISQDVNGKITVTKKNVRTATTNQTGVIQITQDNANLFLNTLSIGSSAPSDNDYYISQYANGGTTTTTYHRRPVSKLYDYIKSKTDTLYPTKAGGGATGTWGIGISGNAATATKFASAQSITLTGDTTGTKSSQAGWSISTVNKYITGRGRLESANIENTSYLSKFFTFLASSSMTDGKPAVDGSIAYFGWDNGGWAGELYVPNAKNGQLQFRGANNNSGESDWEDWVTVLDTRNYTTTLNSTYLKLSGGTLTGAINTANGTWNKIGDDIQIGDINRAGHLGIKGINGNTGIFFVTYGQTANTTGGAITWDGTKFSITSTTPINATVTSATTATNLANKPSLAVSDTSKITVTAGGKTSDAFTVPYATSAGSATTATIATNLSAAPTITKTGTSTVDLTAGTAYTLTVGGQSVIFKTPADSDTKVTLAAITSGTAYYPVVGTGTGNAQRQIDTTGFAYKGTNGTTSAVGAAELTLGNSTASGTANNKQGKLTLYGSTAYTHTLLGAPTSARTITLPDATGTVELTSHIHGNLTHDGKITSTTTIANGDKLVIVDSDTTAGGKITGSTIIFDGSTTTKALTQKGTWETFNNYSHPTGDGNLHVPATGTTHNGQVLKAGSTAGSISWGTLSASDVGAATSGHTHATTIAEAASGDTNSLTLAFNKKYKLTTGGTNFVFTTPANPNTDTKVNVSARGTTKAYLLATSTSPTTSAQGVTALAETGVYLDTAGELIATKFTGVLNGTANIANKLGTADKGSGTKPIYLAAGVPTECSTYAGGTAVTLNGASKAASTASFYAPTSAGNNTQALVGGTPTWTNISPSISIGAGTGSAAPTVNVSVLGKNGTAQSITTASTAVYGVTKLQDGVSSDSTVLAATAKAAKTASTSATHTLATTTKFFVTGCTSSTTNTAGDDFDTGVYVTTTAGEFSAVRHSYNVAGVERAYTHYNMTDQSIDFVFV